MKFIHVQSLPKMVALFLFVGLISTNRIVAQIVINEIVASNGSSLIDEDGDSPDWIELYNSTDSTVNLSGFGISDDLDEPFKYIFSDVSLESDSYYLIFASDKDREGYTAFWETVIREGDGTKYIVPQAAVSDEWVQTGFEDSSWLDGVLGIGYGDNDDATQVPNGTLSVFSRTKFTVSDASKIQSIMLHLDYDDGYVAYLNGQEVHRINMQGESPIRYNASSTIFTEPKLAFGEQLEGISLNEFTDLLIDGENVLAIQMHNSSNTSSDITLIPFLSLGFDAPLVPTQGVAEETNLSETVNAFSHTNFKLSSSGETLYLSSPDSEIIDELTYPELKVDESYGRSSTDNSINYLFLEPTPLAANTTEGFIGRSPDPEFVEPGGLYSSEFELNLVDPTKGNVVYFSFDGAEPTSNSLKFGLESRTIGATFTLRFITIENGKLPSNIVTHTYIIGQDHDLPVVSVSTDPENLWSDETGIYVEGTKGISGNCTGPRNWNQDWEIPINVELFEADGTHGFTSRAGAKIFGGCSRSQAQKSLSIFFRPEYGNAELKYKLFEEKDIDKFQGFVLRNSGNDFNNTHLRDGVMKTLAEDTEIDYQAFKPAVVYLNGEYWGIQNIREKVNEHFLEANNNAKADDVELIGPYIEEVIHGSGDAFLAFYYGTESANMQNDTEYQTIEDLVDIDNYIDYMAAQIFYANTDWPGNNIKYWRDGANNGKWRWIMYDTDFGFNLYNGGNHDGSLGSWANHNTLRFALLSNRNSWPTYQWSTLLFRQFVKNEIFQNKFVNRMADLMNTSFETERMNFVIDSLAQIIEVEMPLHKDRWGGTISDWEGRVEGLRDFANDRVENMEGFIEDYFGVDPRGNLTVQVSNQQQGSIKVNRVIPKTYPWVGKYFGGVPVKVSAISKPGYEFTGWSGSSSSTDPTIEVQSGASVTANFAPSTSQSSSIVINEVMYNASSEQETGDWIEFFNNTNSTIDLTNWVVKDDDDTHEFSFSNGTEIEAGAYVVVAADLEAFNTQYDNVSPLYGNLGFNLAGGSDEVRLYDDGGVLIDSLQYDDEAPWDSVADGTSFTLELKNPDLDNTLPESWKGSTQVNGTPGASNTAAIVSNENEFNLPTEIRLSQNYPNPFNPSTSITFELPTQENVNLSIFDMLGRRVAVLANEVKSAGVYTLRWNASQQASGVYFYRLEAGKEVFSKKMLLIK